MPSSASLIATRLLQIVATCTTFSLVVHRGGWRGHGYGDFCMFIWCVCFSVSVIVMILDVTELHGRLHVSWRDLTISVAMTAAIGTAVASIMYPVYFLSGYSCLAGSRGCDEIRGYRIGATITSILATAAYAVEVSLSKARQGEVSGLMATVSGLTKVVQVFIACVIFAVANERNVYNSWSAKEACLAIVCICFILSFFAIIFSIIGWPCNPNFPIRKVLAVYALLAFLAYVAVAIVWPVYSFDDTYGQPSRTCKGRPWGSCVYDDNVSITVAIYVNLVAYAVDLFYMHSYLRMTTT
uniref:myeloid-associated differentiation marker homolog n=1 Tax=Myxine glutinosa TaxID=7769 RepID=UPI00358DDF0E